MTAIKNKILIVDDNEALCQNLSDILELEGYDTIGVYDGYQAIESIKKSKFDVVLLDFKMPGLSGLDTLKLLNQIIPNIVVIMITAFTEDIFYNTGLENTCYKVIQKPIDIDNLLKILRSICV